MKKLFCVLLTLLLIIALTSCASEQPVPPPDPITLTTDNIDQYLSINGRYGNVTIGQLAILGDYYRDSTVILSMNPIASGVFYNTKITLKVDLPVGWQLETTDPAYSNTKYVGDIDTTISLPTTGRVEQTHDITQWPYHEYSEDLGAVPEVRIISVEGTFQPHA